jgi:hypothetical protein
MEPEQSEQALPQNQIAAELSDLGVWTSAAYLLLRLICERCCGLFLLAERPQAHGVRCSTVPDGGTAGAVSASGQTRYCGIVQCIAAAILCIQCGMV